MHAKTILLKDFKPDFNVIADKYDAPIEDFEELVHEAQRIAKPVGSVLIGALEFGAGDEVIIEKIKFVSPFLKERLGGLHRVFPYIATEGHELALWGSKKTGKKALVHLIRQTAVKQCEQALEKMVCAQFDLPVLSSLNPGSLKEWPLTEQKLLFETLKPLPETMGITLLSTGIMQPDYTVSGLFFQTDKKFYNCQLCPRENCPNRKAPRNASA